MIALSKDKNDLLIRIPKGLLLNKSIEKFIERIEFEELCLKNAMTEEHAWEISEELKENWFNENEDKILERIKNYEKSSS